MITTSLGREKKINKILTEEDGICRQSSTMEKLMK